MTTEELLKTNQRLRKDIAKYQSELEGMELRVMTAEAAYKDVRRRLEKLCGMITTFGSLNTQETA